MALQFPMDSNALLAAVEPAVLARFKGRMQTVALAKGQVLQRQGDSIDWVVFPHQGLVAVLAETPAGEAVESSMVGRDGVVGAFEACGSRTAHSRAVVQIAGEGCRLSAPVYRELFSQSPALRNAVHKYVELTLVEARQSVACNALHDVESRLCRAILEALDRSGLERILPLTQEGLALMLGVQRTTVAACISKLQRAGLIRSGRGALELRDRRGLERSACTCRQTLEHARRETLGSAEPSCESFMTA